MIAKVWKKIGLFILIIACLFNVIFKFVDKATLKQQMQSVADYIEEKKDSIKK